MPGVLVYMWPCGMMPSSIAIAFVHDSFVKGLLVNFTYLVMVSPLSEWISGFHNVQPLV